MRVLFLDIDGVLNNTLCHDRLWALSEDCLHCLKSIVHETKAQIVISSSWRFSPDGLEAISRAFDEVGIPKFIGTTGFEGDEIPRSRFIKEWLANCKEPVVAFAILDDNEDAGIGLEEHFFQTDFGGGGLTMPIANKVIKHLLR